MKSLFAFLVFLFSVSAFSAEYFPPTQAPNQRNADIIGSAGETTCNGNNTCSIPIYGCKGDGEWLVQYHNESGQAYVSYCQSCPSGYAKGSIFTSEGEFVAYNCQQHCESGYKLLRGKCQSCPEVYKEWRIDDPAIGEQCLEKKCPDNKMLDTKTGQCVDYDPKCGARGMDTIYPPSGATFKAFCSTFCKKDPSLFKPGTPMEYRSSNFSDPQFYQCRAYPNCPLGQKLKIVETKVNTTLYEDVKCETTCRPDQIAINGSCFQKCAKDEFFIDGQCTDKDPIVESIKWFDWNISDAFYALTDYLEEQLNELGNLFDNFYFGLDDLNEALEENPINNGGSVPDSVNTTPLDAETPFKNFNFNDFFKFDLYKYNAQCPADRSVVILKSEQTFKYTTLCNALETISKLLLALAVYFAATILWRDD